MRESVMLPAVARSAGDAAAWVAERLAARGHDAAGAEAAARRVAEAWELAGSALFGRAREGHQMLVAIRGEGAACEIDLVGDMTVSRRLARQIAERLGMEAGDTEGAFCLTLRLVRMAA